jgi:hypothetical protein
MKARYSFVRPADTRKVCRWNSEDIQITMSAQQSFPKPMTDEVLTSTVGLHDLARTLGCEKLL